MPTTSNRQASIDSRRIALEREITIRVPRFDTFVTEYSTNISTTGMFIVSEKPHAPGTTFAFEFSVADDWKLIRGRAQVVWARYRDEDKERPAGMGVRFVELDAQSRRLIRWIVEKHIREGGRPFELDELRSVIDEALEDVVDSDEVLSTVQAVSPMPPPKASPSAPQDRPRAKRPPASESKSTQRNILPLVATAAVIVIGLIFLFWLTEWIPDLDSTAGIGQAGAAGDVAEAGEGAEDSPPVIETTRYGSGDNSDQVSESDATPPLSGSASEDLGAANEIGNVGSAPLGSAYAGVRQVLSDWSSAWSDQDIDRYLAAYSRDFQPNGSSRRAWEALRRERLSAPRFIKVSISQFDMVRVQDNLVEATFFQNYRSDRFSDSVQKVFELIWEGGSWKILRETTR